ncbi:hypothetical protein P3L10_019727 [Capsicum annuum]
MLFLRICHLKLLGQIGGYFPPVSKKKFITSFIDTLQFEYRGPKWLSASLTDERASPVPLSRILKVAPLSPLNNGFVSLTKRSLYLDATQLEMKQLLLRYTSWKLSP